MAAEIELVSPHLPRPPLTDAHRFIGCRNPTWYILPKSARLMDASVYASRIASSLLSPLPWRLPSLHLVCERIQSPQALALRLSWHRHLIPYPPPSIKALALSVYNKNQIQQQPLASYPLPSPYRNVSGRTKRAAYEWQRNFFFLACTVACSNVQQVLGTVACTNTNTPTIASKITVEC